MTKSVRHNTVPSVRPDIDTSFTLNTIWTVTTLIETALSANGTLFRDEDEKTFAHNSNHSRYNQGRNVISNWRFPGHAREEKSLFQPLEGLREIFDAWSSKIGAWAMRAKYFRENTLPFLEHQCRVIQVDTELVAVLRIAMRKNGEIDHFYINNFRSWARQLKEGLDEHEEGCLPQLHSLAWLLRSVVEEGNEGLDPGQSTQPVTNSRSTALSHLRTVNGIPLGRSCDRPISVPDNSANVIDLTEGDSPPSTPVQNMTITTPVKRMSIGNLLNVTPVRRTTAVPTLTSASAPPSTLHQRSSDRLPQWKAKLADRYPISRLSAHPFDNKIYARANYLCELALNRLAQLISEIEGYILLSREMKVEYDGWMRRIHRLERMIIEMEGSSPMSGSSTPRGEGQSEDEGEGEGKMRLIYGVGTEIEKGKGRSGFGREVERMIVEARAPELR